MKRLKKLLLLISVMACAFCFSFGLVACGHEHTFDTTKWEKDATNHWHPATCEHTDEKGDLAAHSYDAITGDCVCGAHEHKYSTTWATNNDGHYHAAICSDKDQLEPEDMKDYAPHDTKGAGGTCSVCGYKHEHTFGAGWVTTDPQFHWHEVTCGHELTEAELIADPKAEYGMHNMDTSNAGYYTCPDCGYRHDHVYGELTYNKNNLGLGHWREDTCGHHTRKDEAPHSFDPVTGDCECGAHQHVFDMDSWEHDEDNTHHWHPATCSDKEDIQPEDMNGYAEHEFDSITGDCECGEHEHIFGSVLVNTDPDHHWYPATCSDKDDLQPEEMKGYAAHNWDKTRDDEGYWTCKDCGYKHTHTYDEENWTYDKEGHWHAANCGCDLKKDYEEHNLVKENNNTCACGYHEHTYDPEVWEKDDVDGVTYYHWNKLTCQHDAPVPNEEKPNYALHDYDPDNGYKCVCGETHQHEFNKDVWVADGDRGHYHQATCEHTDLKTEDFEEHNYDASFQCQDCHYQHTHTYAENWTYNDDVDPDNHYHFATCHPEIKDAGEAHQFNALGDCVCGKHQHVIDRENWTTDNYGHWHSYLCDDGEDLKADYEEHVFVGGECETCHYAHEHDFNESKYAYDSENHYYWANCGHAVKSEWSEPHQPGDDGVCEVCGYSEQMERICEIYNEFDKFYNKENADPMDLLEFNYFLAREGITDITILNNYVKVYKGDEDTLGTNLTLKGHDDIFIRDYLIKDFKLSYQSHTAKESFDQYIDKLWFKVTLNNKGVETILQKGKFDALDDESGYVANLKILPFAGDSSTDVTYTLDLLGWDEMTPEEREDAIPEDYKYMYMASVNSLSIKDDVLKGSVSSVLTLWRSLGIDTYNKSWTSSQLSNGTRYIYVGRFAPNVKVGDVFKVTVIPDRDLSLTGYNYMYWMATEMNSYRGVQMKAITDAKYECTFTVTQYAMDDSVKIYISTSPSGYYTYTVNLEKIDLKAIDSAEDKSEFVADGETYFYTSSADQAVNYTLSDGFTAGHWVTSFTLVNDNRSLKNTYKYDYELHYTNGGEERVAFKGPAGRYYFDIEDASKPISFKIVYPQINFVDVCQISFSSSNTIKLEELTKTPFEFAGQNAYIFRYYEVEQAGDYKFTVLSRRGANFVTNVINVADGTTTALQYAPKSSSKFANIYETTVYLEAGIYYLEMQCNAGSTSWDGVQTGFEDSYKATVYLELEDKTVTDVVNVTQEGDKLTWEPVEAEGAKYQLYRDGTPIDSPTTETSYTLTAEKDFEDSDNHSFWVRVVIDEHYGLASNVINLPIQLSYVNDLKVYTGNTVVTWSLKQNEQEYATNGNISGYLITLRDQIEYNPETADETPIEEPITIRIDDPTATSADLQEELTKMGENRTLSIHGAQIQVLSGYFMFSDSRPIIKDISGSANRIYLNRIEYPETTPELQLENSDGKVILKLVDPEYKGAYDIKYGKKGNLTKTAYSALTKANGYQYEFTATNEFPKGTEMEFYAKPTSSNWYTGTISEKVHDSNTVSYTQNKAILTINLNFGAPDLANYWPESYYGWRIWRKFYNATETPIIEIRSVKDNTVYGTVTFGSSAKTAYCACDIPEGEEVYAYMSLSTPAIAPTAWTISFGTAAPPTNCTTKIPGGFRDQKVGKVTIPTSGNNAYTIYMFCYYNGKTQNQV